MPARAAEGAGFLARWPGSPSLLSLSLSGASHQGVDVVAQMDVQEHCLGRESVHSRLILLSILTAASLFNVRVREVCEREAGNVGRRDGEPGAGRHMWPALLCTPGRWWGRKVFGALKRRLGAQKACF